MTDPKTHAQGAVKPCGPLSAVKAMSADPENRRILKLHFKHDVTDADRQALLDWHNRALIPAPAVPDDVTEIVADLRESSFATAYDCAKYADIIEAQAAELALTLAENEKLWQALNTTREKGLRIEREANALQDVGASLEAKIRIKVCDEIAALTHPTGGST